MVGNGAFFGVMRAGPAERKAPQRLKLKPEPQGQIVLRLSENRLCHFERCHGGAEAD